MVYEHWLERWNLKSDPCKDIEMNTVENLKFLVPTKNINAMRAEIQDILNSNVGVIKPLVGSRGSGKTTCLYYLIYSLGSYKEILPVYTNLHESLSMIQESPFPITFTTRFVTRELILQIGKSLKSDFIKDEPIIENIIKRAKQIPCAPTEIPKVTDQDLELLIEVLKKKGLTVVFAIDELDKFETKKQVKNLADFFKNEQALLTKLASKNRTFFYISSSTRWDFLQNQDFSYLAGVFYVEKLDFAECKRILEKRFEICSPGSKPPFTDSALQLLISIFNGNPRRFILAAGHLLRLAHDNDMNIVTEELVKKAYGEESRRRLQEDYEEIISADKKAGNGALLIWYLCTKIPSTDVKKTLDDLIMVYKGKKHVAEHISNLDFLEGAKCLERSEADGSVSLHEDVISFFKKIEEMGHSLFDFAQWYSSIRLEPPGIPYCYKMIQELYSSLRNYEAKKNLVVSWEIYFSLEISTDQLEILSLCWKMLAKEITAFCLEYGTYRRRRTESTIEDVSRRKAVEFLGVTEHEAKELLINFLEALHSTKIELQNFGLIAAIFQKSYTGSGIMEANLIKEQAKLVYDELLKKWLQMIKRRPIDDLIS
jgi:Cdc6-like AAA superfamily ATPase